MDESARAGPATWRCEVVDKHLRAVSAKHLETRVVRVNAEKSPYLVEKLRIRVLPTMVLVKDGKTDHSIIGFDELGGSDDFTTEQLEEVLAAHGVIYDH
jgi:thioredoxin-like negative regulator of GroEL